MSHNNRLSRTDEQDWRDTLAAAERRHPDVPSEPATPDGAAPWVGTRFGAESHWPSDVEFMDELQDRGREIGGAA
jgi:hypothetical protein